MEIINKLKRVLKKPPEYIVDRVLLEAKIGADRFFFARYDKSITNKKFLKIANADSIDSLWDRHKNLPFALFNNTTADLEDYSKLRGNSVDEIIKLAERTISGHLNLLGSGDIYFGNKLEWNKDYKTGVSWRNRYYRDLNYVNFSDKSDVKVPWEISRMQWLIPVGQAYFITKDEKYAIFVKEILIDWFESNVYAHSVNWTCTMEVALRIIVWEWFFYAFSESSSWKDEKFRIDFLKSIYLHGFFTERNLEKSDVNGNHYTADGAGLVFAGLFFKGYQRADKFFDVGWDILESEMKLQVFPDGVDYEASVPYHRLVAELFYFPALYMKCAGKKVPVEYIERLIKMGEFSQAYARFDGSVPLFGDADDARTLPMGLQKLNDHLYLSSLIGLTFNAKRLVNAHDSVLDEIYWVLGYQKMKTLPPVIKGYGSKAFCDGGFFIMGKNDHQVFIDCGPLGLAGRGGHGHNDILSFEAHLHGETLISDSGAYLYTADYIERNKFRSTAYHNTPMVDGQEINRFITPKYLWNFHNDAIHKVLKWSTDLNYDVFIGSHSGYERLDEPVSPTRTIILDKDSGALLIQDVLEGKGKHTVEIPMHLGKGVSVKEISAGEIALYSGAKVFMLNWKGPSWSVQIHESRISPSYGVVVNSYKLIWTSVDALKNALTVLISKEKSLMDTNTKMDELLAKAI